MIVSLLKVMPSPCPGLQFVAQVDQHVKEQTGVPAVNILFMSLYFFI